MTDFTELQINDFRESFNAFDRDNNGSISRSELRSLLYTVGHKVKNPELDSLLTTYDADKSKTIDFEEFLQLANRLMKNKLA